MRSVVSWSDLGCHGVSWVSWGIQTDPLNLVQVIAFIKNLLYFLSNKHFQSSRPYKQINANEIQHLNRGFFNFQGTSQSFFFLRCVFQIVEMKKISAPYTVYSLIVLSLRE